jgi:hypothetical protein
LALDANPGLPGSVFPPRKKKARIVKQSEGKVVRATSMPSVHDGFDTTKNSAPMTIRAFTPRKLAFWARYGITPDVLSRYQVVAVQRYRGTGKSGKVRFPRCPADAVWLEQVGRMHSYLRRDEQRGFQNPQNQGARDAAMDIFKEKTWLSSKELKLALMDVFKVQDRTARSYIRTMKEVEIIEKSSQFPGDFRLVNK